LNISEVKIRRTEVSARLKAVVSVTFDQEFVLHDVKLIDGGDRLFLAMPSRRLPDGTYCDIAHPISHGLRKELEESVIRAYREHQRERTDCGGGKSML
jgi:stage V sporulation protein G